MNRGDELVTVFSSVDKAVIAVAKTILDGEGIKYIVGNENVIDLFGYGALGGGFDPIGPVYIQVDAKDAEIASGLLRELSRPGPSRIPWALRIFAIISLALTLAGIIYTIIDLSK
ncbi:MAG: DUF2007 domain-containing protein [Armatimonadota bacterium]